MKAYSLTHLADSTLLQHLAALVARDRATTAELLAHIAEVDARKLYLPEAYPSMYAYCVGELRFSEEAAFKRIHAARAARRFPAILEAVADGRLHLSAVILLAPHLNEMTAEELLAAATHKTKSEVEQILAARFPRPDLPTRLDPPSPGMSPVRLPDQHAPGRVDLHMEPVREPAAPPTTAPFEPSVPAPVPAPPSRVTPLAPERFGLQVTISQATHDKLRHAQDLLGHQVQSGDVAQVLDLALDALIRRLEARKFAATERPRPPRSRKTSDCREIPAHVRRAVWQRDGGQCTFRSDTGHRCPARRGLEFDHVHAFARGGEATVSGIQLRCRAHNQYEAERTFGTEFIRHKREAARGRARSAGTG